MPRLDISPWHLARCVAQRKLEADEAVVGGVLVGQDVEAVVAVSDGIFHSGLSREHDARLSIRAMRAAWM